MKGTEAHWHSRRTEIDVIHVWPCGDLFQHALDDEGDCWCEPDVKLDQTDQWGDVYTYTHRRVGLRSEFDGPPSDLRPQGPTPPRPVLSWEFRDDAD